MLSEVHLFTLHLIHLTLLFFCKFPVGQDILFYLPKEVLALPNIKFSSFSHFTLSFRSTISIRHSFYRISMLSKVHDGYSGNFSDTSFQILVTRCNNVAFVLGHPINWNWKKQTNIRFGCCVIIENHILWWQWITVVNGNRIGKAKN